ncbi:MAG: hypothetical protein A3F18_04540 [Legionellales bacterium RIFCSPHIGHO2_12_FULL_37_14]|nr:MAG: hypothetical protein A3F18_04540 [Legionellales bacterium RIFCSPHIGHO2_12_FULL_37_14]
MDNSFSQSLPFPLSLSSKQLTYFLMGLTCFFLPISISIREVLFVLTIITIVSQHEERLIIKQLFWTAWGVSITALVFLVLLSSFWSIAPVKDILNFDVRCVKLLYIPFLVAAFRDEGLRKIVLNILLFALTLVATISIFAYLKLPYFAKLNADHVFQNHVIFGFMGSNMAYLAACLAAQRKTKYHKLYFASAVIIGLQVLWVNEGRMGYIMLDCLAFLWMWQYLSYRQIAVALILYLSVCFAAFYFSEGTRNGTLNLVKDIIAYKDNSNPNTRIGYRFQYHDFANQLFLQSPIIGHGVGAYSAAVDKNHLFVEQKFGVINDAHGQYWLMAVEQGVIGVALLFLAFASLFVTIWRNKKVRPLALGLLGTMALGQFADSLLYHSPQIYFFIILLSVYLGEIHENSI